MHRVCRERFPRHRLQRKPLISDPGMHHGTCVTHVPWCMSGSLTRSGGENVPGFPGACETRNLMYLVKGPLLCYYFRHKYIQPIKLYIKRSTVVECCYTINTIDKSMFPGYFIATQTICWCKIEYKILISCDFAGSNLGMELSTGFFFYFNK